MSKRILVIDDEVAIRTVIKITLEVVGEWTVFAACSAKEGLAIAEAEQPDAILLDIMMPDVDGLTLCRWLRNSPTASNIPIFLITAKMNPISAAQAEQLGIAAIFAKPFEPLELSDRIAKVLNWQ
jgi:CheY-like chemotaxis protein